MDTSDNATPIAGSSLADNFTLPPLGQGTTDDSNNFGELAPATVQGFVYIDSNNDGVRPGTGPQ